MKIYNLAILGCGNIAHKHAQAIEKIQTCRLAAVCDKDSLRGQNFAGQYNATWYENYSTMLADPSIDIVCICTPSGLHAVQGIEAAKAGKHVLVEKPMALSIEDADRLIATCRENEVYLAVVYQNRFKTVVKKLRRAVESNMFGKLTHGNATVRWNRNDEYYTQSIWRGTALMDGGVLMNQAIHNIDLLQWMMGRVESVFAYTATRLRKIECEDVGVAVLKFSNGALGVIEAASTLYPKNLEETLSIFGSKGTAVIGGVTASEIKTWLFEQEQTPVEEDGNVTGHQAVIEDMIKAISTGSKPLVDGDEGKKSLEIVLAIYESAQKCLPVKLSK